MLKHICTKISQTYGLLLFRKYNVDMIEKYDLAQDSSKLFCSINCMQLFENILSQMQNYQVDKSKCYSCQTLINHDHYISSGIIKKFCSQNCLINFKQFKKSPQ